MSHVVYIPISLANRCRQVTPIENEELRQWRESLFIDITLKDDDRPAVLLVHDAQKAHFFVLAFDFKKKMAFSWGMNYKKSGNHKVKLSAEWGVNILWSRIGNLLGRRVSPIPEDWRGINWRQVNTVICNEMFSMN